MRTCFNSFASSKSVLPNRLLTPATSKYFWNFAFWNQKAFVAWIERSERLNGIVITTSFEVSHWDARKKLRRMFLFASVVRGTSTTKCFLDLFSKIWEDQRNRALTLVKPMSIKYDFTAFSLQRFSGEKTLSKMQAFICTATHFLRRQQRLASKSRVCMPFTIVKLC